MKGDRHSYRPKRGRWRVTYTHSCRPVATLPAFYRLSGPVERHLYWALIAAGWADGYGMASNKAGSGFTLATTLGVRLPGRSGTFLVVEHGTAAS